MPCAMCTAASVECGFTINAIARTAFRPKATRGAASTRIAACSPWRRNRSTISTASMVSVTTERSPLQPSTTEKVKSERRMLSATTRAGSSNR